MYDALEKTDTLFIRNEANFDVCTIYCDMGQFTLIIHEADFKKSVNCLKLQ
jgi:hypothetical protein